MALKNYLSTVEAARELGITSSLVRRYIRDRALTAEQLGQRSYAIERREVERFKRAREAGSR